MREHLKAGRAAVDAGDLKSGMGQVAIAFDLLIAQWGASKYLSGDAFQTSGFKSQREYVYDRRISVYGGEREARRAVDGIVSAMTKEFREVDSQLEMMRQVMRLQVAGIDMPNYVRFAMLAPAVAMQSGGGRSTYDRGGRLHYSNENYDFCESFVVDSALRIGRSDFVLWFPRTFGEYKEAEAAMEANGGRLPGDFSSGAS
ncbi:hypothetical protein [Actinokineospora sp. HUAS TT18]|uniref:hypothetical protein n=1 Tax=Actinokineospora sp. HUAS TT18 TaxID=3447451 RepID=UPI003F522EDF